MSSTFIPSINSNIIDVDEMLITSLDDVTNDFSYNRVLVINAEGNMAYSTNITGSTGSTGYTGANYTGSTGCTGPTGSLPSSLLSFSSFNINNAATAGVGSSPTVICASNGITVPTGAQVVIFYGVSTFYNASNCYNSTIYRATASLPLFSTQIAGTGSMSIINLARPSGPSPDLSNTTNGLQYIHTHNNGTNNQYNSVSASFIDNDILTGGTYYYHLMIAGGAGSLTANSGNPSYIQVYRITS